MATVVVDSNPSLLASLRVDDEGYLMVTGVSGGGSSRTPEERAEEASQIAQREVNALLNTLTSIPSGPQRAILLSTWRTALKAKLIPALT